MDERQELSWIKPLDLAANEFLEVLVDEFKLTRKSDGGTKMAVEFDNFARAIWNRRGKDDIRKRVMPNYGTQWPGIAKKLENYFFGRDKPPGYNFRDAMFPFRYCSGGALPMITVDREEYYRLHWRDIHPVGWNITNGGSDNVLEMLDPQRILYRELLEELLIFDIHGPNWVRLTPQIDDGPAWLEDPHDAEILRRWQIRLLESGLRCRSVYQAPLPLGWMLGPDDLEVAFYDRKKDIKQIGGAKNVFLNVNAEDFGIEVDRVVRFELPPTAVICDGEMLEGMLLNSAIGLFRVHPLQQALRAGKTEFRPDILFHGGRRYEGTELPDVIARFQDEKQRNGLLRGPEREQFEEAKQQMREFDLCPVSRNILRRVAPPTKPAERAAACDVFISFASEDETYAREVYHFLSGNLNQNVFFSPESIRASDYSNAIFEKLTQARRMIVVASSLKNLRKNWVDFEYRSYFTKKMEAQAPAGEFMFTILLDMPQDTHLPLPLSHYQVFSCRSESLTDDLEVLRQHLIADTT